MNQFVNQSWLDHTERETRVAVTSASLPETVKSASGARSDSVGQAPRINVRDFSSQQLKTNATAPTTHTGDDIYPLASVLLL